MPYWRVKLPPGVRSPFEVYVNGVRQELGTDYRVEAGELLFERELVRQKLGLRAWLLGFWGIGTYKRNDEVDIRYEVDGQPRSPRRSRSSRPPDRPAGPTPDPTEKTYNYSEETRSDEVRTTSRRTHGRSSRRAARIARVAGERLSV